MLRIAILTSHDAPRLTRAIDSVQAQSMPAPFWVEVNTQDAEYQDYVLAACARKGIDCHASASYGTPGGGKQAVFDRFADTYDDDFLMLLDGDDWLYPSAVESMARLIKQYRGLDVLSILSIDKVMSAEDGETYGGTALTDDSALVAWQRNDYHLYDQWPQGPGRGEWLFDAEQVVVPGRSMLFSRRAAYTLRWNHQLKVYEDGLLLAESLAQHQAGRLFSSLTNQIDVYIADTLTPDSMQKWADFAQWSAALQALAAHAINPDRAALSELPMLYPFPLMSYESRIEYVKQTHELPMP